MTKSNPYAAHTVIEATKKPLVDAPVGDSVPDGAVNEILDWVGSDTERAQLALDKERSGHARKTLIRKLEEFLPYQEAPIEPVKDLVASEETVEDEDSE